MKECKPTNLLNLIRNWKSKIDDGNQVTKTENQHIQKHKMTCNPIREK